MKYQAAIRVMHEGDLPWLLALCSRRYSDYDPVSSELWFRNTVLASALMFYPARTSDAFTITMLSYEPWRPADFIANVIFTCADDGRMWQVIHLLRDSVAWARRRKCVSWRIWSDTGYDIGPLARRLGAREVLPRFSLEL